MKRSGKRILLIALLVAALLPVSVYAVLHLPHITVTVPSPSVAVADTFTVTVSCREMTVGSYTAGLSFDPDCLEVISIQKGSAPVYNNCAASGVSTAEEANAAGKVGLYAVHKEEAAYKGGTLLTVTFRALKAGTAVLTPYEDCDGTEPFRALAGRCEIAIGGGEGTVALCFRLVKADSTLTLKKDGTEVWSCAAAPAGEYALPVATGTYLLEVAHPQDYTRTYAVNTASSTSLGDVCSVCWGDINGSGETDVSDLQALYEYLSAGTVSGMLEADLFRSTADTNCDGSVDVLDYQWLYENLAADTQSQMEAPALLSALSATPTDAAAPATSATATNTATPTDTATPTAVATVTDKTASSGVATVTDGGAAAQPAGA